MYELCHLWSASELPLQVQVCCVKRTSPFSVSRKPAARASWSIFHALSSPSPLPVKTSSCLLSTSSVQISERCATIVCIQCCVPRSQSLRKVSFEVVRR